MVLKYWLFSIFPSISFGDPLIRFSISAKYPPWQPLHRNEVNHTFEPCFCIAEMALKAIDLVSQ